MEKNAKKNIYFSSVSIKSIIIVMSDFTYQFDQSIVIFQALRQMRDGICKKYWDLNHNFVTEIMEKFSS